MSGKSGYFIDRWYNGTGNAILEYEWDSSIDAYKVRYRTEDDVCNCRFCQYLDPYHVSLNGISISYSFMIRSLNNDDLKLYTNCMGVRYYITANTEWQTITTTGTAIMETTGTYKNSFGIFTAGSTPLSSGKGFEIANVKLVPGLNCSPYIQPMISSEMVKCFRHYRNFGTYYFITTTVFEDSVTNNTVFVRVSDYSMKYAPTVSCNVESNYCQAFCNGERYDIVSVNYYGNFFGHIRISITLDRKPPVYQTIVYELIDLRFDAEIYPE